MDKQEAIQHILVLFSQHGLEPSKTLQPYQHTTVHRVPEENGDTLALEWFDEGNEIGLRLVFLWPYGEPARDSQFAVRRQPENSHLPPPLVQLIGREVEEWYLYMDETYGNGGVHFAASDYARRHNVAEDHFIYPVSQNQACLILEDMFHYYLLNRRRSLKELIGKTR
jgi:hypothetical protein